MQIKKVNIVTADSAREESILQDVIGVFYPYRIAPAQHTHQQYIPLYEFRLTNDQIALVRREFAKSDEQRMDEWMKWRESYDPAHPIPRFVEIQ